MLALIVLLALALAHYDREGRDRERRYVFDDEGQ